MIFKKIETCCNKTQVFLLVVLTDKIKRVELSLSTDMGSITLLITTVILYFKIRNSKSILDIRMTLEPGKHH
jgi:hypothetical protein